MARGRKAKRGKRERNGRISRAGKPRTVDGNQRAIMNQKLYGQNGVDAIGRAFEAGLLGEPSLAKALMDTARGIASAYRATYVNHAPTCALAGQSCGGGVHDPLRDSNREQWLKSKLSIIDNMVTPTRTWFDQMVIDPMPDHGPLPLDRILDAKRKNAKPRPCDEQWLDTVVNALRAIE
jgi:hypothetical protein